jgi:hypothetical protein
MFRAVQRVAGGREIDSKPHSSQSLVMPYAES